MKKSIAIVMVTNLVMFTQCGSSEPKETPENSSNATSNEIEEPVASVTSLSEMSMDEIQSDPVLLLEWVFYIANNHQFENLIGICDPNGDGDVQSICNVVSASAEKQDEFIMYFEKGTVDGEDIITGETAKVSFLFGPNGGKSEEMNFVKIDGLWYLSSF